MKDVGGPDKDLFVLFGGEPTKKANRLLTVYAFPPGALVWLFLGRRTAEILFVNSFFFPRVCFWHA